MSGNKRVAVSDDAAEIVTSLKNFDPNAPSSGELQNVSGTRAASGATYVNVLEHIGASYSQQFAKRLAKIREDCEVAGQIIQELQELDSAIASEMQRLNGEVEQPIRHVGTSTPEPGGRNSGTTW